jgi:hypothetical protein
MGLIIVLGLSIVVGIVGFTLNKAKSGTIENVAGFHKYTSARNIAHTAVNMALRALDRNDSVFIATKKRSSTFMGGDALVEWTYPFVGVLDTIDLTSVSSFMDTTHLMRVRLHRRPVPFPIIGEAVGLRVPNVNFQMTGTPNIDGRNHTMGGALLPSSPNDKPGVGVIDPADTTTVQAYGSKIDGTVDVINDTGLANPADYITEYINAADRVFTTGVYGANMVWGSPTSPYIVYCDGDVKFNGTVDGWGILVVRGNLTLAGNFTFRGLVVVYEEVEIDVQFATGTPDVIGAVLMAGPANGKFVMKGNSKVAYSKEALEMAMYINKLQVYRVLSWYE